jgi:hypothetical protein
MKVGPVIRGVAVTVMLVALSGCASSITVRGTSGLSTDRSTRVRRAHASVTSGLCSSPAAQSAPAASTSVPPARVPVPLVPPSASPVARARPTSGPPLTAEQACGTGDLLAGINDFDTLNGWSTSEPPNAGTATVDTYGPTGHEQMPQPNPAAGGHFVYGGQVPQSAAAGYISRLSVAVTLSGACVKALARGTGVQVRFGADMGMIPSQSGGRATRATASAPRPQQWR